MINLNILKWLDNRITYLKNNNIKFNSGVAILEERMLYNDIPVEVEPYDYRNDVSDENKKKTVLLFYMDDRRLLPRLKNFENDIQEMKEYAAVSGFDISASILMLRMRQKLCMLINSVYNCCLGLAGIKILPNARCGDFGTISLLGMYPKGCNIIISNHGCKKHGFKYYGLYQTLYINDFLKPKQIFSYGNVSKKEYKFINKKYKNNIIVFPEHRKKRQYKKSAYTIGTSINASFNNKTGKNCYCSFILQDKLIEIKPLSFDEKEAC